jgi:poly(hydroxyalkanoate) depolymerase family esterase
MNKPLQEELARATRLTREGRLAAATAAIRRALAGLRSRVAEPFPEPFSGRSHPQPGADVIDVTPREAFHDIPHPAPAARAKSPSGFHAHHFQFGQQRYRYRVYLPSTGAAVAALRPVIVMLHGCKQDSADFARGTQMNGLAEQHGCIVVYPEQISAANSMRCWNWFEPAHQQRDSGEPAMIAALTREIVAQYDGDPARVYVAGLSAGGAMAATVAQLHPELFAAVGVHSGLAPAVADDLVSAFSAMRKGRRKTPATDAAARAKVPAIVFHGTADQTVHPANGERIVEESLETWEAQGARLTPATETIPGARQATRTVYTAPDGTAPLEVWEIDAGPHAWSGGSKEGSFTDPHAPGASAAMLAFFLRHRLRRA